LSEAETGGRNGTFGSTLRQLSAGPAEAGIGLVVLSTRAGIVRLRDLANRLQGTRTLIAVLPAPVRETTPDDAEEYVDGVARALPGTPVSVVAGGSAAGYLAARLAEARAAQQADPPVLVMLEPPLPDDMMRIPLATLLRLPEVVLQRFEQLLGVDSLSQAAWDTPQFRRDVMAAFRDRRADLEAAIHSVDRTQRLVAPELPMDLYTEWAGSVSYCMQLRKATYAGPTMCVEGRMSAELAEAVRQRRFAEISRAFPRASFHRTDVEHAELLTDAVLHRYFAVG
jgi:hypothetical protein